MTETKDGSNPQEIEIPEKIAILYSSLQNAICFDLVNVYHKGKLEGLDTPYPSEPYSKSVLELQESFKDYSESLLEGRKFEGIHPDNVILIPNSIRSFITTLSFMRYSVDEQRMFLHKAFTDLSKQPDYVIGRQRDLLSRVNFQKININRS